MDLYGPLLKNLHGNRHVLFITYRFTKLCRSIPLRTTQAHQVAQAFLDAWVYPCGMPNILLTDNGPQFTAKFFDAVCGLLGCRHVLTTAYHPQTNGQAEKFNRTLATRLRHYVSEHQRDWDDYVHLLTYAYNMQVHKSTGKTPFDIIFTRHPPGISVQAGTSAIPSPNESEPTSAQMKRITLQRVRKILSRAGTKLTHAQAQYKINSTRPHGRCHPSRSDKRSSSTDPQIFPRRCSRTRMATGNSFRKRQLPIGS